jgi:uncharacterized membrane protein
MHDHAEPPPTARARHREEAEIEFGRIVAFSDGVFAIAITLLVLAIEVPASGEDLAGELWDQRDDLFAYAISFAVLAKLWLAHHRFFSSLERFDGTLMGLNLLYLAFVALVPFTSELLGDYSGERVSVIVYAVSITAVSITFEAQIIHAYRKDLVRDWARRLEARFTGPANYSVAAVFLLSIPVALVSVPVAQAMWLLTFITGRWIGDRIARVKAS